MGEHLGVMEAVVVEPGERGEPARHGGGRGGSSGAGLPPAMFWAIGILTLLNALIALVWR